MLILAKIMLLCSRVYEMISLCVIKESQTDSDADMFVKLEWEIQIITVCIDNLLLDYCSLIKSKFIHVKRFVNLTSCTYNRRL